ncbi:hypothetical protein QJS10_CPA01g01966 [Acorus calamus]|uniref:Large ribosomal subunit protein bL21m n=1 Tax=Acorus calamus TaxID=4465 RepID=A0AAV9FGE2_ACOCL|nr:hypothetical protein QJS10_CPA01g01966 [Acorus calamus]
MASRRCFGALTRHCRSLLLSPTFKTPTPAPSFPPLLKNSNFTSPIRPRQLERFDRLRFEVVRGFSSTTSASSDDEEGDREESDDGDEEGEVSGAADGFPDRRRLMREAAATEIGYKVVGPLDPSEQPFVPYEPVFAVVQIGSHQFKVSNGDAIYTERLKFCEVNDKLILNKVLMLGSRTQTIIGRPILPDVAVHAVVEEHALDGKVIIFKKKRRKNYRRTKGHRQELTKLRITNIQGIEEPQGAAVAA